MKATSHAGPPYPGLTTNEAEKSRRLNGSNEIASQEQSTFIKQIIEFFKDPMILLLLFATTLYFINGSTADAIFMLAGIVLISSISGYQEHRSKKAIAALRKFIEPLCTVVRDSKTQEIQSGELVIGDVIQISQGLTIPADGTVLSSHDFAVNESMLTGEAFTIYKEKGSKIFRGTTVVDGLAWCEVTSVGYLTEFGKISKNLSEVSVEPSPLQIQVKNFVRRMALLGVIIFFIVWFLNYYRLQSWSASLLQSLTLAMSILPEEIPVALTTFMALGSWRLMKKGIIVKDIKTVETLGSASVICLDKTGTITENRMTIGNIVALPKSDDTDEESVSIRNNDLIETAMWASEPTPFDPMEKALHEMYEKQTSHDLRQQFVLIKEYPLSGTPPMMTHIFRNANGEHIIAVKGAPEAIISKSSLSRKQKEEATLAYEKLASQGYRVLAVGTGNATAGDDHNYPETQEQITITMKGLIAFVDPPKASVPNVIRQFYEAGLDVKIVTGDSTPTTLALARQIGLRNFSSVIQGNELVHIGENELNKKVNEGSIFTRMFPDAKLRVLQSLKAMGHIVAMTGDGVNDGPALKAAHIGIAMGKKGSEVAKEAAALIIKDDDISKIVDAIAMARRIYSNLKKGIRYIITIHIPIIGVIFIPLIMQWEYASIFTPVHVIFFELVMGPTCSVVYENEPIEQNLMNEKPKRSSLSMFSLAELTTSVVQGLMITAGLLWIYKSFEHHQSEEEIRTMVFVALISANVFLTLVNRSFRGSFLTTLRQKNILIPIVIAASMMLSFSILAIDPLSKIFGFAHINSNNLVLAAGIGFLSVFWFEAVKAIKRK